MQTYLQPIATGLATLITIWAFSTYILKIVGGKTIPHVFSWVVWGVTTSIVFVAMVSAGGGMGAWPVGLSGAMTLGVAWLSFKRRGDITITRLDWAFFLAALGSIPLWLATHDPLWAVVLLTTVDILGFGPTIRKAYDSPFEETPSFYLIYAVRNGLVLYALEERNLAGTLFPAAIGIACAALALLIVWRRRVIGSIPAQ
ncbi:hypothetical protein [Magnetofaba australis]|uniref:Uncharacterized protein n=1 Tax=Magnetofaba australis IT-1 TaxID=1434232 RepID=A0A1Y2K0B5_9PROT|nr:hypothetical protein [Magnetofaba australis]OSM01483.1 hypothetical protein MAIT1_01458 [Magnetofaba australis IT-1]